MPSVDDVESGYLKTKKKLEERNRLKQTLKEEKSGKKKKKGKKAVIDDGSSKEGCSTCTLFCCLIAILCVLAIPIGMNYQIVKKVGMTLVFPSSPFGRSSSTMEEYFTVTSNDVIGSQVLGATKDEVMGFIKAGKNCAVLYSDDPSANDQALATRICPEMHDSDIYFHMRGVFGTHPNKDSVSNGEPRVQFVASGGNVWTTFFDQHNSTRQTYTVPPSHEVNMSTLTGADGDFLPDSMDTVKVVHSMYFIQKTRGAQVSWPSCASFYASVNIVHTTHGFMVCRHSKKTSTQVIDKLTMERLNMVNSRGEMAELAFIVPGPGVSVKIEFAPDPEGAEELPIKEVLIRAGRTNRATGNDIYDSDSNAEADWRFRPKQITLSFAETGGGNSGGEDADE